MDIVPISNSTLDNPLIFWYYYALKQKREEISMDRYDLVALALLAILGLALIKLLFWVLNVPF